MKYFKRLLALLIVHFSIIQNIHAQSVDSIAMQRTTYMKQLLALSNDQSNTIKTACVTMLNSKNNLQTLSIDSEEKSKRLKKVYEDFRIALKNILTTAQWNTYEQACITLQQRTEQYLQKQKIKYTLLKTQ